MVTVLVEILKSSVLLYVGFLNIRRYVLYLYIETLKQRLDAINQLRVDRALAAMGPAFQQVYSLLPTLLHYHHPLMPGYLDGNVPAAFASTRLMKPNATILTNSNCIAAC